MAKNSKDRRATPRYKVRSAAVLEVSIQPPDRRATNIEARLCDVSLGGAKLLVNAPLSFDADALVHVISEKLDLNLSLDAAVCWMKPNVDSTWSIGCRFEPQLPVEALHALLRGNVLERRDGYRQKQRIPVVANWEGGATPKPAVLWDVSAGGFCILSSHEPSRRVVISPERAPRPMRVAAQTQWNLKVSGGHVVGCKFTDSQGPELIDKFETSDAPTRGRLADFFRKLASCFTQAG